MKEVIKKKTADEIIKEVHKDLKDRGVIEAAKENGKKNGTRK